MKNIGIKLMLFMMLSAVFAFTAMAQTKEPGINISLINQEPDPASPGKYVELRFKVFNDNPDTVAHDFQVVLQPEYPFSLDTNEVALRSLGDLPATGNSKNAIIIKYKVRIDDNAVEGQNPITIKYRHDGMDYFSQEFNIDVQSIDANIAVVSVNTTPESISPGEQGTVKITIRNMALSTMKDVTMKLDMTFSSFLTRTTLTAADSVTAFNALPFAPIGSSSEQKIYTLGPGEEKTFTYNLIAFPSAVSQVYKVPIVINYYDELNTQYTKNDIIGIVVGAKPDISVLVDSTDITAGAKSGKVSIKFVNKGVTGIKFLDVKLDSGNDFDVTSASEVYIGTVDSDDYETADYSLFLKSAATNQKTISLPVHAQFRDANNNLYNENYDLQFRVISSQEAGKSSGAGFGTIVVILVVVGIAFFFWRRSKKKTK
jgi:hypothetical protein